MGAEVNERVGALRKKSTPREVTRSGLEGGLTLFTLAVVEEERRWARSCNK
jgi:hypothetical protein